MLSLNFSTFPNLATEHLALRQLVATDVAALVTLRCNEIVNKYLDRPKSTTLEDAIQFINKITAGITNGQSLYWVIGLKENNELIGTICLWNIDTANENMEIGYELLPSFHGKNIMQEAIQAVIDFGFNTIQLKSISAFTAVGNIASKKLLERNSFKLAENSEEINGEIVYVLKDASQNL